MCISSPWGKLGNDGNLATCPTGRPRKPSEWRNCLRAGMRGVMVGAHIGEKKRDKHLINAVDGYHWTV